MASAGLPSFIGNVYFAAVILLLLRQLLNGTRARVSWKRWHVVHITTLPTSIAFPPPPAFQLSGSVGSDGISRAGRGALSRGLHPAGSLLLL